MECPHTYHPKLDESGKFWKGMQTACLQAFSQAHWNSGESHWYSQACKFHTFQTILRRAVSEWGRDPEFIGSMKRGLEEEHTGLYVFSTNADLGYKLTPEERGFLRELHLEEFVTSVSWGVLHSPLVKEAIASLDTTALSATVKGEKLVLITKNWRKQFKQIFHLTSKKEQAAAKEWQLDELFPSVKVNSDNRDTLRIVDCQYPGAKRPLRLLSSLLCLNPTHQHHIAYSFAEHIVAALNGKAVDWPQEFHREMTEELVALHAKHHSNHVKVGKTSIGPHVTIILKAAGVLDIREEFEAGYRTPRALTIAEQMPHPKRKKAQAVKTPGSRLKPTGLLSPDLGPAKESLEADPPTAPVYSVISQTVEGTGELPQGRKVTLETTEPSQPPKTLPPMVEQICQAHRRLENLLVSFTSKAPARFVNQMSDEFFRIQREATLKQPREHPNDTQLQVLLMAQETQLQHLATQLANAEGLNDVSIETIFHLEEETATLEHKLYLSAEQVLSLTAQKGEALGKLQTFQEKMDAQTQLMTSKIQEISGLNDHVTDLEGMLQRSDRLVATHKETILRLESQVATIQQEVTDLTSGTQKLAPENVAEADLHQA